MKKLFYDLETTGLDPDKNGIHQISGCIEINGKDEEWFNFKVRPFQTDLIDEKALETSHVTKEQIMSYQTAQEIHNQLLNIMSKHVNKFDKKDKFFLIGYNNIKFDDQFLRSWFLKLNDKFYGSWFWSNTIDVMSLATNHLMSTRSNMENFKLMSVAKQFGIEVDERKLHDALYDVKLTRDIYKKIQFQNTFPTYENKEICREPTYEEYQLLGYHILNDDLQAIYDYYDLKDKLDKEWVDRQMYHQEELRFCNTL
jgi:DNA polymerase-3 subunit epsilon